MSDGSNRISRRQFLSSGAAGSAALAISLNSSAQAARPIAANPGAGAWVRWLDDGASKVAQGVTWGTPWPRGKVKANNFALRDAGGKLVALQSWPLAWWPDGSIKWSAHAL